MVSTGLSPLKSRAIGIGPNFWEIERKVRRRPRRERSSRERQALAAIRNLERDVLPARQPEQGRVLYPNVRTVGGHLRSIDAAVLALASCAAFWIDAGGRAGDFHRAS